MASDLSIFIDGIRLNIRVGVVMSYENDVVLEFSNTANHVVIPGGRMKIGEPSQDAIVREVDEEMGLKLDKNKLQLARCFENFFSYKEFQNHEIYFVFNYQLSRDERDAILKLDKNQDNEDSYFKIVSKGEIEKLNILPVTLVELLK